MIKISDQPRTGRPSDSSVMYATDCPSSQRRDITNLLFSLDGPAVDRAMALHVVRSWQLDEAFEILSNYSKLLSLDDEYFDDFDDLKTTREFLNLFDEICDFVGFNLFFSNDVLHGKNVHELFETNPVLNTLFLSLNETYPDPRVNFFILRAVSDPHFIDFVISKWFEKRNSKVPVSPLFIYKNFDVIRTLIHEFLNLFNTTI